jgi:hypothetical protein
MVLNTLNTLITDILLTVRNSNISESESINRIQIEQWIHQYRALLIKQDIDKNRDVNPQYIQYLTNVPITITNNAIDGIPVGDYKYKVSIEIPRTIDFNFKHGIVYITDPFGNIIQFSNKNRSTFVRNRKYTRQDYTAYLEDNYLYIVGPGDLRYITVGFVAEDPSMVTNFSADDVYPVPASMIPTIRQMILSKELNIMTHEYTDKINNNNDDTQGIKTKSN